ncbi:hypothetical protein KFL_006340070 [Klebsormidium nitens]|uniref:EF-hand domain-containing protein n=1 Tax=Klebsormidium nitens TaxID=105231 RepID=A0A1Y1IP44_KLENI|nr:hypothetical protein KFL_006340070 [Klebsormidium nitens]|eukprot:GAQ90387.1 hypothetical protein KFL_006340070 [Klebsormidium nitens]
MAFFDTSARRTLSFEEYSQGLMDVLAKNGAPKVLLDAMTKVEEAILRDRVYTAPEALCDSVDKTRLFEAFCDLDLLSTSGAPASPRKPWQKVIDYGGFVELSGSAQVQVRHARVGRPEKGTWRLAGMHSGDGSLGWAHTAHRWLALTHWRDWGHGWTLTPRGSPWGLAWMHGGSGRHGRPGCVFPKSMPVINEQACWLDFSEQGSPAIFSICLDPGNVSAKSFVYLLNVALASGLWKNTYLAAIDSVSNKISITANGRNAVPFKLLFGSGPNAENSLAPLLGFTVADTSFGLVQTAGGHVNLASSLFVDFVMENLPSIAAKRVVSRQNGAMQPVTLSAPLVPTIRAKEPLPEKDSGVGKKVVAAAALVGLGSAAYYLFKDPQES